jgi:hypothetical protein
MAIFSARLSTALGRMTHVRGDKRSESHVLKQTVDSRTVDSRTELWFHSHSFHPSRHICAWRIDFGIKPLDAPQCRFFG